MNNNKFLAILIIMLFPTALFAANRGFYVGGGLGLAEGPQTVLISSNNFNNSGGTITGENTDIYDFSTRDNGVFHLLAGYNFNQYLGVEASASYLGKQDIMSFAGSTTKSFDFNGNMKSYYYGVAGVGHIPLDQMRGDLFAKLGLVALNSKVTINDPMGVIFINPGNYNVSTTDGAVLFGAGAQYYVLPKLAVAAEWNRISRFNNNKIGNVSYNQFLIDVVYSISNI